MDKIDINDLFRLNIACKNWGFHSKLVKLRWVISTNEKTIRKMIFNEENWISVCIITEIDDNNVKGTIAIQNKFYELFSFPVKPKVLITLLFINNQIE